jgi:cell surface protein SprA
MITGSYSISIIAWGTSFEKISKNNDYVSPTFEKFKENREIISTRRAQERQSSDPTYNPNIDPMTGLPITGSYKNGYGETSREVLVPAFIAAYTKRDASKVNLETFPSALRMMPNWRISFDGLSRIEFIQKTFRSIILTHQYRSTYQVASFTTNLSYQTNESGVAAIRDLQNNFLPQYELNVVSINEQFSPLINVDMNWQNSLSTRFEWRKSRTVSLNLASNQVADARINELIVGAGYRFNQVQLVMRTIGGGQRSLKSDLNVRMDFSVRDNKTIARKLVENVNQPMIGQKVFTISTTADYMLSDRFNIQVFADHSTTNPFVANTFPVSNTNFGFSLKFTLM